MSWNFQHLEVCAEKIPARRFFDEKIRFGRLDFQLEPEAAEKLPIRNHRCSERVTTNRATKLPLNLCDILDVIDVSVCEKQELKIDTERFDPFTGTLRCVEKDPALWRFNQVTIRFKNATAELLVIHRV